jgi:hypothetical protein
VNAVIYDSWPVPGGARFRDLKVAAATSNRGCSRRGTNANIAVESAFAIARPPTGSAAVVPLAVSLFLPKQDVARVAKMATDATTKTTVAAGGSQESQARCCGSY